MVCREVVELVTEYHEGALSWRERRSFERHVRDCDGCEEYVEQIRVTVRTLGELPAEPADPHVQERLLAAFRDLRG